MQGEFSCAVITSPRYMSDHAHMAGRVKSLVRSFLREELRPAYGHGFPDGGIEPRLQVGVLNRDEQIRVDVFLPKDCETEKVRRISRLLTPWLRRDVVAETGLPEQAVVVEIGPPPSK